MINVLTQCEEFYFIISHGKIHYFRHSLVLKNARDPVDLIKGLRGARLFNDHEFSWSGERLVTRLLLESRVCHLSHKNLAWYVLSAQRNSTCDFHTADLYASTGPASGCLLLLPPGLRRPLLLPGRQETRLSASTATSGSRATRTVGPTTATTPTASGGGPTSSTTRRNSTGLSRRYRR